MITQEKIIIKLREFYKQNRVFKKNDTPFLNELKFELQEYLRDKPLDTKLLLNYALASYLTPIGSLDETFNLLDKVLLIEPNNFYAIILSAYLQDTWCGGINKKTYILLDNLKEETASHQSIVEMIKSWNYSNIDIRKEQALIKAILLDPSYPQHHIDLGMLYLSQDKHKEGREYINIGLKKIKKIINDDDSPLEELDCETFINVFIKGYYTQHSIYNHLATQCNK